MTVIGVTGGTGFVGEHFLRQAVADGHSLRALTRRGQDAREGIEWKRGDLHDQQALVDLCQGCDAVVHIAGAISANDRAGFAKANIEGTEYLLDAAKAAGTSRFVHVSTLAAREPDLSDYGWSKAESEERVRTSGLDWTIIRPPAVYGPGDRETLELFRMARRGRIILPPPGRLSLIHVSDLVALLLACIGSPESGGATYEPDDGHEGGRTHKAFGDALGAAIGRKVRTISMPAKMVHLGARLDRMFRGSNAKLTADRARYFCHPDWVADPEKHPPSEIWSPLISLSDGLGETARWYREKGWLS